MITTEQTSRRTFLSTSAMFAATSILGLPAGTSASNGGGENQEIPERMIERVIGRTGISVPVVGMGVMNAENPALVRHAYERGIRHFDTAANYQRGRNEEMLGKVIAELGARDKVTVATKVYLPEQQRQLPDDEIRKYYLKSCEESLRRLGMDQVDILYSHSVSTPEWLNHRAVLGAMEELKSQKKTRFIGFTTHANMNEMLKDATRTGAYDVALASFNYSFFDYREYEETLEQAAARGIGLVAMKTQCQQPWYKAANPEGVRRFYDGEIVHSALLKWVLRHDCISCAVPGYTAFGQVEEDLPAGFSLEYTAQEKKFLEDRNVKLGMTSVCRLCGECVPSCPADADIPALMRVHMYSTEYGNVFHARQVLDELPAGRAVRACASCAYCSARCTRGVDIDRRIGELKALFA